MKMSRQFSTIGLFVMVSLSFCQITHAAITDGIIAYWPFDGNANDTVGTNHGTLEGGATYTAGKLGQAVACDNDGNQKYVSLTREDTKDGDWTVATWVNVHSHDTGGLLAGTAMSIRLGQHGASTKPGLSDINNNVNGAWDGSDSQTSNYDLPSETWVLLVFVGRDTDAAPDGVTDEAELYADNVSYGKLIFAETAGSSGSGNPATDPVLQHVLTWDRIGELKNYYGYGSSVKDIDEVIIWDRSLSTGEVAELWNSGDGIPLTRAHYLGFAQPVSNGPEDGAIASIEVEMNPPLTSGSVTVNYTVTDIDTDSADYSPHLAGGILTFTTGVSAQTVDLTILNDTEPEDQEQLQITLWGINPGGEDVGMGLSTHVYTIQANTEGINIPPAANDQNFSMRAAELLALPILLAASDADHDPLTYSIVAGPSNGALIGTGARIEYLPDSTFRGVDTFTYKASDALLDSNIATVAIDVAQEACTSAQVGGGPVDSLFVHVPSHLVTADISTYQHVVSLTGDTMHESASSDPAIAGHVPFVSRNDLTNKSITIDLGETSRNVPLSISFKLIPTDSMQNELVMQAGAFDIETSSGSMISTWYNTGTGKGEIVRNR